MQNTEWKEVGKSAREYTEEERKGRHASPRKPNDLRSPFEKDRDRIIHCAAFRRLQGKTQVFGMGGSDFFRTRLTHSLETAQIGKGIGLYCGHANVDLIEAACLAHDIGHPPFGHTGEFVLKEKMRDNGGFEANAQNIRILNDLEVRSFNEGKYGLNISMATFDAILKYKKPYSRVDNKQPIEKWKFYYDADQPIVEWASDGSPRPDDNSFECQIMNWADDIAYSTHDLENGIKVGMISTSKITSRIEKNVRERVREKGLDWEQTIWDEVCQEIAKTSVESPTEFERKGRRRDLISGLIHGFITSVKAMKRDPSGRGTRYQYRLSVSPIEELRCNILKSLVWELIIDDVRIATLGRKATTIVGVLFDEFTKFDEGSRTLEMYPTDFREKLVVASDDDSKLRVACDYISGMTDGYASRMFSRLREGEPNSLMDLI